MLGNDRTGRSGVNLEMGRFRREATRALGLVRHEGSGLLLSAEATYKGLTQQFS